MVLKTITNEGKMKFTLNPLTNSGNPAQVEAGSVTWAVSSGDCTVVPDADGMSAYVVSGPGEGVSTIDITADADLGTGVKTLSDAITMTVVLASAGSLGLISGEEEPK